MDTEEMKKLVAYHVADLILPNTVLGIGTGSTVHYFIERLGERAKDGLLIHPLFSSNDSEKLANSYGIFATEKPITAFDLTVDGADEIDPKHSMIKGGGGALLREKMLASASKEIYIIVDEGKCRQHLSHHPLPVEIIPFATSLTIHHIEKLGLKGSLRKAGSSYYVTDNGNYIYDIALSQPIQDPKSLHNSLIGICGVVETGLFFNLPVRLFVGTKDNKVLEA